MYLEACYLAGIKTIPDDKCCQLLAWAYVYGGGHEATVMNVTFSEAILAAQRKLNILGGEVPDQKLAPIMLNYIKSVTDFNNPPEWVTELEKEYGIKSYRSKK
jgi:hypothetical protein